MVKERYKRAISTQPSSEYYTPQAVECSVDLNGAELKHCITANETEGWADVLVTDNDEPVILKSHSFEIQRVSGFVKIHTPENWLGFGYSNA